jgi:hypothetical protein
MTNNLQELIFTNFHLLPEAAFPILTGCAAFGASLALSTAAQKWVGISTATKVLPTLNGIITVCAASLASERAAILAHQWQHHQQLPIVDLEQLKTQLWATSSHVANLTRRKSTKFETKQHNYRFPKDDDNMPSDVYFQHKNNKRQASDNWLLVRKLPMHDIRV